MASRPPETRVPMLWVEASHQLDGHGNAEHVDHRRVAEHSGVVERELHAVVHDGVTGVGGDPSGRILQRGLAVAVSDNLEFDLVADGDVNPPRHFGHRDTRSAAGGQGDGQVGVAVGGVVRGGTGDEGAILDVALWPEVLVPTMYSQIELLA